MKTAFAVSALALGSSAGMAQELRDTESTRGGLFVEIWPGEDCVDIVSHMTWATVAAVSNYGCQTGCLFLDAAGDADPFGCSAVVTVGGCGAGMEVSSASSFWNLSCDYIRWFGGVSWWLNDGNCPTTLQTFGVSHGFFVSFDVGAAGNVLISPPGCPLSTTSTTQSPSRHVAANLLCIQDSAGSQAIASHYVFMGGLSSSSCNTSPVQVSTSGTVSVSSFSIIIDDAQDDVTGDGRFNQSDVDFLAAIVGTPDATSPVYARFDYVNEPGVPSDDGVDPQDLEILQCFIDAGLSSGYIGDATGDGKLTCEDISVAASQPFAGEAFPSASYKVELDADLDGDNDAADRQVVADALLIVEPANFSFDDALNIFDINSFLALYNTSDPRADLYPPGSPDGIVNFFDYTQFQTYYANPKCP